MKKILAFLISVALAAVSAPAQGLVIFSAGVTTATRISTNSIIGGTATGLTAATPGGYRYALFCSKTATTVSGNATAVSGPANSSFYVFNDNNWSLVAYGTNTLYAGRLASTSVDDYGQTTVPGVAGGTTAQFVVVGWSASIGSTIASVQNWLGMGDPLYDGWIGQSAVSGPITLGDGAVLPAPGLFGNNAPALQGFTLGRAGYGWIFTPPFILTQPTNMAVTVGATASFSVLASGDPAPAYQWRFNGTNISGATSQALTIPNVQLTNAGIYSVFISNTAGSTNSSDAVLTVGSPAGTPPAIANQPTNLTVQAGGSATFRVVASGSNPLSYQWTFNGTNLVSATNTSLSLVGVQTNDAGNYAVAISNDYGVTNSSTAVLIVQVSPPFITVQPVNASVLPGNNVVFAVAAGGTAPLNYQWKFDGTNLAAATNAALFLPAVQTNNAGTYAVTISNRYGITNSSAATLTILPPCGFVLFLNTPNSATRIMTNSSVGGAPTGFTTTNAGRYYYALFASTTATTVNGQTAAILGNSSGNYAFADGAWTLVAYGTNTFRMGRLSGTSPDIYGQTAVPGILGGYSAQFVVIGWSANLGTDIASVQSWFNNRNPAFDGWIGQSAVSGAIWLGDGGIIPTPSLFGAAAPLLQGFTLGLVSPNLSASYAVPFVPSPMLQAELTGNSLKLSWPASAGSYAVQSADTPAGPWSDTEFTVTLESGNSTVTVLATNRQKFFRLIVQ